VRIFREARRDDSARGTGADDDKIGIGGSQESEFLETGELDARECAVANPAKNEVRWTPTPNGQRQPNMPRHPTGQT
jgi:hypothetical protein